MPVSPVISTPSPLAATRPIARNSSRIAGLLADQLGIALTPARRVGAVHGPRMRQRTLGGGDGLIEIEGLGQIVERAVTIRRRGRCDVGERAHDDDRKTRLVQRDAFEQLEPADARHAHVGVEHGRRLVGERGERVFGIAEFARHEAGFAQRRAEHEAHAAIVVDDPDTRASLSAIAFMSRALRRRTPAAAA